MEAPLPGPRHNTPFTFRDLTVWKQSRGLASDIYRLASKPKLRKRMRSLICSDGSLVFTFNYYGKRRAGYEQRVPELSVRRQGIAERTGDMI